MHPNDKGSLGELIVAQNLLEHGWECFLPISHNTKIDMIAVKGNRLVKIQVKTTSETSSYGAFPLYLKKTHHDPKYDYFYEVDSFDYFAVVHLPTKSIVYITAKEVLEENKHQMYFSLNKESQKRVDVKKRFVEDYKEL